MSSTLDKIAEAIDAVEAPATNATVGKRGFTLKAPKAEAVTTAKGWVAQYDRGVQSGKYPRVGFSPSAANFLPMIIVAMIPGFTSDTDAIAKVRLVQKALGAAPTDRINLGLKAMASPSAVTRDKTLRTLAPHWIAVADAKGVYRLRPTKPSERVAAQSIRPTNAKRGPKPAAKGKGKAKVSAAAKAERTNGAVKITVDKALKSAADKAERAAQRAANRAKQAAQHDIAKHEATVA